MKKAFITILGCSVLFFSCNLSTPKTVSSQFVGQWKFYAPYKDSSRYDGTMDNIVCGLDKLPNTDSSFVFHFWFGRDAILTIKDDSTLVGQNIQMYLRYQASNSHLLILHTDKESGLEFQKLN
ncbi:MAG: hypothetical protein JWQ09_3178 [Segetibacter sp.]|nr:hypothetical protein [Segetibacter sp.]